MSEDQLKSPTIALEPPWWRCENGNEFRSGPNKPPRCPVCGSTKIEMVVEVDPVLSQRKKGAKG
jgi:predicted Zn-ribbon and HTH transcriptional regulator